MLSMSVNAIAAAQLSSARNQSVIASDALSGWRGIEVAP
jgi:hypothetical protein